MRTELRVDKDASKLAAIAVEGAGYGGEMATNVKEAMLKRVEIEWQWERKLMIQQKNEMWKVLEKYIEDVKKKY